MDVPLSNMDLLSQLNSVNGFKGVFSYDLLPNLKDGNFCVVNTDNVIPNYDPPEGGHHWLTVCSEKDRILIFDSFGRNLSQMEVDYTEPHFERYFRDAYPDRKLYSNIQVLQNRSTAVCGHYAILVGKLFSSHGIDDTLNILRHHFSQDTLWNDRKIVNGYDVITMGGDWTGKLADEMHKQRRVHFPRRSVIVHDIDNIWSADLVDMQIFSKYNKNFKFLLTVIDLFSRYAWIVPLKNKTGASVRDAFQHITETSSRSPRKLWVDEGKEFYNSIVKKWVVDMDIHMYSTHNEGKAVVVERFNRTMKSRMWRHFTASSTNVYINVLPKLLEDYNNAKHRSIGMTPTEASDPENGRFIQQKSTSGLRGIIPRFRIGDEVRIAISKRHFEKGYTPNWTEEVFIVHEILPTAPITYRIRDLMNEHIQGSFYAQQLQKALQTKFRIDKVLRKHRGQALVKWKGYSDKFNSWVPSKDLESL